MNFQNIIPSNLSVFRNFKTVNTNILNKPLANSALTSSYQSNKSPITDSNPDLNKRNNANFDLKHIQTIAAKPANSNSEILIKPIEKSNRKPTNIGSIITNQQTSSNFVSTINSTASTSTKYSNDLFLPKAISNKKVKRAISTIDDY
jgi:hypothetical protein